MKDFQKVIIIWVVYLCVNVVGGTFAILPINERFLEDAIVETADRSGELNFLTDHVSQNVLGLWYGMGAFILLALFVYFRHEKNVPYCVPLVATLLWMGFAIHFQLAMEANWTWRLSICYYVATFAVAVVTQILAVQSVEPILDKVA